MYVCMCVMLSSARCMLKDVRVSMRLWTEALLGHSKKECFELAPSVAFTSQGSDEPPESSKLSKEIILAMLRRVDTLWQRAASQYHGQTYIAFGAAKEAAKQASDEAAALRAPVGQGGWVLLLHKCLPSPPCPTAYVVCLRVCLLALGMHNQCDSNTQTKSLQYCAKRTLSHFRYILGQ